MEGRKLASVLLVAYEAAQLELFIKLGRAVRLSGRLVPILYCPYALPEEMRYRRLCAEAGIEYLQGRTALGGRADILAEVRALQIRYSESVPPASLSLGRSFPEWTRKLSGHPDYDEICRARLLLRAKRDLVKRVLQRWEEELPAEVYRCTREDFRFWLEWYATELRLAREIVRRLRVAAIFLAEHIVERDSVVWTRVAAEEGIASLVIAQHTASRQSTLATYSMRAEYQAQHPVNALFLEWFPQWLFDSSRGKLTRLPAAQALAQEWWGLSVGRPWVPNHERITGVWLESDFLAELYIREGVPPQLINVVGSPDLDELAQGIRPRIYGPKSDIWQQVRVDDTKPLLVSALPSNLYPQRKGGSWETYEELIHDYLTKLRRLRNVSYVCALHPSAGDALRLTLEALKIPHVSGRLTEVLPRAQVYIASASSSISWALACGLPVINYDVYGFNYDWFSGKDGVLTVWSPQSFQDILEDVDRHFEGEGRLGRTSWFSKLRSCARQNREYYGRLDGRCLDRIVAGINELVERQLPVPDRHTWEVQEAAEYEKLLASLTPQARHRTRPPEETGDVAREDVDNAALLGAAIPTNI